MHCWQLPLSRCVHTVRTKKFTAWIFFVPRMKVPVFSNFQERSYRAIVSLDGVRAISSWHCSCRGILSLARASVSAPSSTIRRLTETKFCSLQNYLHVKSSQFFDDLVRLANAVDDSQNTKYKTKSTL